MIPSVYSFSVCHLCVTHLSITYHICHLLSHLSIPLCLSVSVSPHPHHRSWTGAVPKQTQRRVTRMADTASDPCPLPFLPSTGGAPASAALSLGNISPLMMPHAQPCANDGDQGSLEC